MGLLGSRTMLEARAGRTAKGRLSLTFLDEMGSVVAVASHTVALGVEIGNLLGFPNGGRGTYTVEGHDGHLVVRCPKDGSTTVTDKAGTTLGTLEPDRGAIVRADDGRALGHIVGHSVHRRDEPAWTLDVLDPTAQALGTITLVRTADGAPWPIDPNLGLLDLPCLGATLHLDAPVDDLLGDLLVAAAIDVTFGTNSYTRR